MAEKLLQTRIQLKYDTLENWEASSLVLKAGEAAVATYTYTVGESEINAVKVKYGDGKNTFANLPEVTAVSKDLSDAIAALRSEYEAYVAEHAEEVAADKAAQAEKDAAQDKALADYKTEMANTIAADKEAQAGIDAGQNDRIQAIENLVATIENVMDFVGVSTTDPNSEDGPTVEGVTEFHKGDVVAYDGSEFVFDGTVWAEFGNTTAQDAAIDAIQKDLAAYKESNNAAVAAVDKKVDDLDTSLAAIAKTGNVNDLIQTEGDVLVFNCGSSTVNVD